MKCNKCSICAILSFFSDTCTKLAGADCVCVLRQDEKQVSIKEKERKRKKKKSFFHKIKELLFEMFTQRQQSYLFYYVM